MNAKPCATDLDAGNSVAVQDEGNTHAEASQRARGIVAFCPLSLKKHAAYDINTSVDSYSYPRSEAVPEGSGPSEPSLQKTRKRRYSEVTKEEPNQTDDLSRKRSLLGVHQYPDREVPRLLVSDQYITFGITAWHMVEEIPEPLRKGIMASNLWKKERAYGGPVTNCVTMYQPETALEDAFLVIRLGYREGFDYLDLFQSVNGIE